MCYNKIALESDQKKYIQSVSQVRSNYGIPVQISCGIYYCKWYTITNVVRYGSIQILVYKVSHNTSCSPPHVGGMVLSIHTPQIWGVLSYSKTYKKTIFPPTFCRKIVCFRILATLKWVHCKTCHTWQKRQRISSKRTSVR